MQWTMQQQIKLNPKMYDTHQSEISHTTYKTVHLQPLQAVDQHVYLGVKLHSWLHHIQAIANKATTLRC